MPRLFPFRTLPASSNSGQGPRTLPLNAIARKQNTSTGRPTIACLDWPAGVRR